VARHGSSALTWNAHRQRFVQIVLQSGGSSSAFGELWYVEADTPLGPWVYARKVVTHDNYTFYNPRQHPFFDQAGGRVIFFEGSYTTTFADDPPPTPRYEYNQIMYRLDLDDPRRALPVAVYDLGDAAGAGAELATKPELPAGAGPLRAAFFAPDRPAPGLIPLAWSAPSCAARRLVASGSATPPLFYAVPSDGDGTGLVPLYEHEGPDGRRVYRAGADAAAPSGFTRSAAPIAFVWPSPIDVALPIGDYPGDVIANAGADQCVVAIRATSAPDEIEHYVWHLPAAAACEIALGARVTVTLPAGLHAVRLEVIDATGRSDSDTLLVEVSPPP
jgi:hypothetical protein